MIDDCDHRFSVFFSCLGRNINCIHFPVALYTIKLNNVVRVFQILSEFIEASYNFAAFGGFAGWPF